VLIPFDLHSTQLVLWAQNITEQLKLNKRHLTYSVFW